MKSVFYLLLLIIFSSNATAIVLPENTVYRVDKRGPDKIFKTGFESWGDDDNIYDHVAGHSITARTSRWVATTIDVDTAISIALRRYNINQGTRGESLWIYEIAQTNNMYNFHNIFEHELSSWFLSSGRRDRLRALVDIYENQREIGALEFIRPAQIVRARQVVYDRLSGTAQFTGDWIYNEHYDENTYRNTRMNQGLYTIGPTDRDILGTATEDSFYPGSWCIGQRRSSKSSNDLVCDDGEMLLYTPEEILMSTSEKKNYFPYDL